METVLISGGSGMVGTGLAKALIYEGYKVIIISRQPSRISNPIPGAVYAKWDIEKGYIDREAFATADHIIQLAGANVGDKRWTKKRKKEILESRVLSGRLISDSVLNLPNKVKTVLSPSGIGWYGPDLSIPNPFPFTEDKESVNDFLGQTCQLWESALDPVINKGVRLVKFRTGIVLSMDGGALKRFLLPLKFRVATVLGNGKQMISWIHEEDLFRIYLHAIRNTNMTGVYNAVAPEPISNKDFVKTLARVKYGKGFFTIRVPEFILKTVFGELSMEVLKSATVSSEKLRQTGFEFRYPRIETAFEELVNSE
jgi:uncharacterized protein (TIGR01777 family)